MVVKNPHVVWNMHETEDSCPERTLPDNKLFMPLLWQNIFILRVHVGSLHRTKVKLCTSLATRCKKNFVICKFATNMG